MSRSEEAYPRDAVTLREVGLRDGLQLVKKFPSTAAKKAWIEGEFASGVRHFEVGSFLPASRMPQFADVRDLIDVVANLDGAHSAALALNERGASDSLDTTVDEIVCVVSATEEHSQANMRRSRSEALELVRKTVGLGAASAHRPLVNAGISMAFGCSISGPVAPSEVLRLAEGCLAAGADIVGLADTVGFVGPKQVEDLCREMARLCGDRPFIVHLHDTRGMGIANASAALDAGARVLDGSLGGLGGCPFAPGATGNIVFEDLVYLCETKGFRTGIDLEALTAVRAILSAEMPEERLYGALAKAGPPQLVQWRA
jgi:hydroxymethylglutaryl-CoA lyase